jgi:hypothetical protein
LHWSVEDVVLSGLTLCVKMRMMMSLVAELSPHFGYVCKRPLLLLYRSEVVVVDYNGGCVDE